MNYFYSGTLFKPHPWHPVLLEIKRSIEEISEVEKVLNVVFLNWYKDGRHSVAWHSDHQNELGKNPIIVSVSLGGARKFMFRAKTDQSIFNLELKNGDVMIMGKGCQDFYHHQVPKVGGRKAEMTLPQ